MILKEVKYGYDDLTIVPNVFTSITSRKEIVTTYDKKIASIGYDVNKLTINGAIKKIQSSAIKEGETVIPIGAVKPYVYFLLEQGNSVFSSSWDNFVEEVNLDELQKDADIKSEAARKTLLTKGLISIIVVVLCWLVLVSTASFVLLKKKHTKALLIGHVIAISIISVLVVLASLIN